MIYDDLTTLIKEKDMMDFDNIVTDNQWYWKIEDGRIWGSKEARWMTADTIPEGYKAQDLYDSGAPAGEDYLKATVLFYGCELGELAGMDELQKKFTDAIQKRLDDFAKTRGYDGIFSATTYSTSGDPQFKLEGDYCVTARDETWRKGYEILGKVLSGEISIPTLDEVMAQLPVLVWPSA